MTRVLRNGSHTHTRPYRLRLRPSRHANYQWIRKTSDGTLTRYAATA